MFFAHRQFSGLGRDALGNLLQLRAIGQVVLDDRKEFFQFRGDLHQRRKNDHERAVLLADSNLAAREREDFRRVPLAALKQHLHTAGFGSSQSWVVAQGSLGQCAARSLIPNHVKLSEFQR